MQLLVKLSVIALAVYGGVALSLFLFQKRLVYFPSASIESTPRAIGIAYEEVALVGEDGVRIHGWWIPAPGDGPTVLFLHGNAGNISHRLGSIAEFHRLGLNVLIIDYRGYGRSEGSPGEQGTYRDAAAAWRHLTRDREIPPGHIAIFGRSLGAAIAAWLASTVRPGALVLESGFTSVPDMAADLYPWLPVRLLARIRYDSRARLRDVSCPVLVAHSPDDELVPYRHGRALFDAATGDRGFLEMRGGHNDGFAITGPPYTEGLRAFFGRTLGGWPAL